jgi:hypothetical protein
MEAKDVWILLAGAFLGFVGSLLATFTAPSVGSAFGKLKSGFIERNKTRALASYAVVRDLKSGKRDKYLYAIKSWGFTLAFLLLVVLGAIGYSTAHGWLLRLPFGAFLVIVWWASLNRMWHAVITFGRLEDFENYRAALLRRWPDIVLPE